MKTTSLTNSNAGLSKKNQRLLTYSLLLLVPYLITHTLNMYFQGWYEAILNFANIVLMMAFFVQFPLGSRVKSIPLFANIDWSMEKHKTIGKWLGYAFLLHPVFILLPKFAMSYDDGMTALNSIITSSSMLTGIIAWVVMIVWVLMSIYKNKLPMSYETWRFTHMLGFVVITVLATLHVTSVGKHGQFQQEYNYVWWTLCTLSVAAVVYNYLIKPSRINKKPFTLTQVEKVSTSDWQVTVEHNESTPFEFKAGQFVWLNTSGKAGGVSEHPFSIASCEQDLPSVSFIIRELGDYTRSLGELKVGQKVFIDGPYGSMSLNDSERAKGITLIAGGAGIGPMLSLLKGLAEKNDPRPIRLIYGNGRLDQMVLQDEIKALEENMVDFKQQLVTMEEIKDPDIYCGVVDQLVIEDSIKPEHLDQWAIYLCGPEPMIAAVRGSLKNMNVHSENVHFEQLAF